MKNLLTFEQFINESAFNTSHLKNIQFMIRAFDKPDYPQFEIKFNSNVNKSEVESAIKSEKEAKGIKYEWISSDSKEANTLVLTPDKDNTKITWVFKALDSLYGKFGDGMGWKI